MTLFRVQPGPALIFHTWVYFPKPSSAALYFIIQGFITIQNRLQPNNYLKNTTGQTQAQLTKSKWRRANLQHSKNSAVILHYKQHLLTFIVKLDEDMYIKEMGLNLPLKNHGDGYSIYHRNLLVFFSSVFTSFQTEEINKRQNPCHMDVCSWNASVQLFH